MTIRENFQINLFYGQLGKFRLAMATFHDHLLNHQPFEDDEIYFSHRTLNNLKKKDHIVYSTYI